MTEQGDAVLMAFDSGDGKTLAQIGLASPPVFDGMIAVEGRLFVSTTNGGVVCYSAEGR